MPTVIKLTHYYSRLKNQFFGVETDWDIEAVTRACAYLQKKHAELPDIPFVDDSVGESDGMALLHSLYGFKTIDAPDLFDEEFGEEIDFAENWDYALATPIHILNQFSVPNASLTMLKHIVSEMERGKAAVPKNTDPHYPYYTVENWETQYQRLQEVINGSPIQAKWGWTPIFSDDQKYLVGKTYLSSDEPELLAEKAR